VIFYLTILKVLKKFSCFDLIFIVNPRNESDVSFQWFELCKSNEFGLLVIKS